MTSIHHRPLAPNGFRAVVVLAAATLAHLGGHLLADRWAFRWMDACADGCEPPAKFAMAFVYLCVALPLAHIVGSGLLLLALRRAFDDRALGRSAADLATRWWLAGTAATVPAFALAAWSTAGVAFVIWIGSVVASPIAAAAVGALAATRDRTRFVK